MSSLGMFISLESCEGGGKTTQMAHIVELLEAAGHQVVIGREPGGTPFGEAIRAALFTEYADDPLLGLVERSTRADTLALFAAREDHLNHIEQHVDQGRIYVSDRFVDSTWAYNVDEGNTCRGFVHYLESVVCRERMPKATLLLDLPVEVSLARCRARSATPEDAMERRYQDMQANIRKRYLKRATDDPERFTVIDANRSIEEVKTSVTQWLADLKLIPQPE